MVEILNIDGTVVTALFQASRPSGAVSPVATAQALAARYNFQSQPTLEELLGEKSVFMQGVYDGYAIDALEVYRDGLIVRARMDSDRIDALIEDAMDWFEHAFGYRPFETHKVSRNYESHLTFRSDDDAMLRSLDGLKKIGQSLASKLQATNNQRTAFVPFGFGLGCDISTVTGMAPALFRVERKYGLAFDLNYYFSVAPLRTRDHIALLKEIERGL